MSQPRQSLSTGMFRLVTAALCGVIAVLLVACGSGGNQSTQYPESEIIQEFEQAGTRLVLSLGNKTLTTAMSTVLQLELECAESDSVEFPNPDNDFGEFAVIRDAALPERLLASGRIFHGHEYELQPFLPGQYEIPELKVVLNGSEQIMTEPLEVLVESVLAEAASPELKDITDPVDVPIPWWVWVLGVVLLSAGTSGLIWWWKRRIQRQQVPRQVPAHETALNALDALQAEDLLIQGEVKPFYIRLSDIVRHYIEGCFGLRAPEQTTQEFLTSISGSSLIRKGHQKLLRSFLNQADMVKFAEVVPDGEESNSALDAARQFITQTISAEELAGEPGSVQEESGKISA